MKKETIEEVKDLSYYKANAEEDYLAVPISVLRYITELEERSYSEEELLQALNIGFTSTDETWEECVEFAKEQFKKK
jgi:hypothetical protein